MGKTVKQVGSATVGTMTGGAWTPDGKGWTQGNNVADSLRNSYSYGIDDPIGKDRALNDILKGIPNIQRPEYPGFKSLLNENNQLGNQFQLNANTQGLDKLRAETLAPGPSPWATAQAGKIANDKGNSIAQNGMLAQSNMRQANRNVSATTGLSGAAQKRMQEQADRSKMLGNQAISRQAMQNTQNVMTQDAQQKDTNLAALPGMELTALQPQQTNIQNTLTQKSARDYADLERYKTEMGSWASANTAKAIEKSGGKK